VAFVRAVTTAPGVELLPSWQDPLTVALPATPPLAAQPAIQLRQLSAIPLRLAARDENPPFHDLILGACADAGFQPLTGPPSTTPQRCPRRDRNRPARLDRALHRRRRPDPGAQGRVPPACRADGTNLPRSTSGPARPAGACATASPSAPKP
jgi:hypothetical protein